MNFDTDSQEMWARASTLLGRTIAQISLIRYVWQGVPADREADLQIRFDDASLAFLTVMRDRLAVHFESWVAQRYDGQLPQLQSEIDTYGVFGEFDVSEQEPFAPLLGQRIEQLCPLVLIVAERAWEYPLVLQGVTMRVAGRWLVVVVGGDEPQVFVCDDLERVKATFQVEVVDEGCIGQTS